MAQIMRYVFDWLLLPFSFLLELANHRLQDLFGLGHPKMATVQWTKAQWHLFRGKKVVKQELDCPDGYLYTKFTFDDGSEIFYRD